jgi:hypothetical protein
MVQMRRSETLVHRLAADWACDQTRSSSQAEPKDTVKEQLVSLAKLIKGAVLVEFINEKLPDQCQCSHQTDRQGLHRLPSTKPGYLSPQPCIHPGGNKHKGERNHQSPLQ